MNYNTIIFLLLFTLIASCSSKNEVITENPNELMVLTGISKTEIEGEFTGAGARARLGKFSNTNKELESEEDIENSQKDVAILSGIMP